MGRKDKKMVSVSGLKVTLKNPHAVETAIRVFKKLVKESEVLYTLKQKRYYKKPSAVRREKRNLAKLRQKYKKNT